MLHHVIAYKHFKLPYFPIKSIIHHMIMLQQFYENSGERLVLPAIHMWWIVSLASNFKWYDSDLPHKFLKPQP